MNRSQFTLRYYCQDTSDQRHAVVDLLCKIREKHGISFEIRDLRGDQVLEREAYERDFKPVGRLLKKRTGSTRGIAELRGRRSGRYYVSVPGTLAIVRVDKVEWYALGASDIHGFLTEVLNQSEAAVVSRLSRSSIA